MEYNSSIKGYLLDILIPLWLSVFIIIFGFFGENYQKSYFITLFFLTFYSVFLIINYKKKNKFHFDLKKGLLVKHNKNTAVRDIQKITVIKRGILSVISFSFSYPGHLVLTKGFETVDVPDFLNNIKRYNKSYRVTHKKRMSLYVYPVVLFIIYGILYLNLSLLNVIGNSHYSPPEKTSSFVYGRYELTLPKEFGYLDSQEGFDIYGTEYGEKILSIGRIGKVEELYRKGYLKYFGISSYENFISNLKNNRFSLFYSYLIKKLDIEEFSEYEYSDIKVYTFYNSKGLSIIVFLDDKHPDEFNVISIKGTSKDEFYNTAQIISQALI